LAVKLFSKYSNLCENHTLTSQTDRRTDRQTTYCSITALCIDNEEGTSTTIMYALTRHGNIAQLYDGNVRWLTPLQTTVYIVMGPT